LYYGAVKGTQYKWLDPKALVAQLVPENYSIDKIRYFTAMVSGVPDPDSPRRQAIYLKALKTIPEVRIHLGSFLAKTIWRPIVNLPVADIDIHSPVVTMLPAGQHSVAFNNPQTLPVGSYPPPGSRRQRGAAPMISDAVRVEVHTKEEKGSDVNLACFLLDDAWRDRYDAAVVISNDTDLVTPIRMVSQERNKAVTLVCPGRYGAAPKLVQVSNFVRHIRPAMLQQAQLSDSIAGTTIRKPATW
jgi:hypothetical protein